MFDLGSHCNNSILIQIGIDLPSGSFEERYAEEFVEYLGMKRFRLQAREYLERWNRTINSFEESSDVEAEGVVLTFIVTAAFTSFSTVAGLVVGERVDGVVGGVAAFFFPNPKSDIFTFYYSSRNSF